MKVKKSKSDFEKFIGVYSSGFIIPDESIISTLSLIFDQFYILNNLEYVIEFSKKYRINSPDKPEIIEKIDSIKLEHPSGVDPLANLTEQERKTAKTYLYLAQSFLIENNELIGKVIKTDLLPSSEMFDTKLIKKGKRGEKNTYSVKLNPLCVSTDNLEVFDELLDDGAVPVVGKHHIDYFTNKNKGESSLLATILAMKCMELIVPKTRAVNAETILEARYKLK